MNILISFAPYIVFFIAIRVASTELALWTAAAAAVLIAIWSWRRGGSLKVLEIGSVLVFTAIAAFATVEPWPWTVMGIRLAVDFGLLAIVLVSLAIRQPFTLQYAREQVPERVWTTPLFLAINYRVTWVWAAAFAALTAAHAAVIYVPGTPVSLDIAVTILALVGAFKFTDWYPEVARKKAGVGG